MLRVKNLVAGYRQAVIVKGISFEVPAGEIRVILGANGAGKTTTIKSLMGVLPPLGGTIELAGREIQDLRPHRIAEAGVAWVPEGRGIFASMTTQDNLEIGAFQVTDRRTVAARLERIFGLFPRLSERRRQLAGSLSGGEQQMLAIGRALMAAPKLLLLDECSLGLAPVVCDELFDFIRRINAAGTTILMVEQNAERALEISQWAYVMELGRVVVEGAPDTVRSSSTIHAAYLGRPLLHPGGHS